MSEELTVSETVQITIQQADDDMASVWFAFVSAIEQFCAEQGWSVEYHLPTDFSIAIFADALLITELNKKKGKGETHD